MHYVFFTISFRDEDPGRMKSVARRASHQVPECETPGLTIGPVRFDYRGSVVTRNLTRREAVFGMRSPVDGRGGFAGLVTWQGYPNNEDQTYVSIDMTRSRIVGADGWIVDFVRQCIVAAGWIVVREEEVTPRIVFPQREEGEKP